MNEFINFDGTGKAMCRPLATINLDRVYRRALFLPGKQLRCVREALASKIIDGKTEILLAERARRAA